ncbi:PilZ domain-containing protein [Tautonia rosea]|uniref:PilZ domain-containing protein n=1 Tax=Tautonia rosea TaxID=2728037 RepID=UPI001472D6AD|nr:PilZ domain-containing protein [Tautonia rosea]
MPKLRHFDDYVVDSQQVQKILDRREQTRYASNGSECWIGWWQGGAWRITSAALRDISQSGAGFRIHSAPPQRSAVWFCPKDPGQKAWVEGTVIRVARPGLIRIVMGCPSEVGLRFREDCTWETLRAALFGLGVSREEQKLIPPPLPRSGGMFS